MLGSVARRRRRAGKPAVCRGVAEQRLTCPLEHALGLVVFPALDLGVERHQYAAQKNCNNDHRHGKLDDGEAARNLPDSCSATS